MSADDLKAAMLTHALYRLHYHAAVTEYGGTGVYGIADIFAYQDNGYTHEFEVKVAAADLAGELAAIKYLLDRRTLAIGEEPAKVRSMSKAPKHNAYLGPDSRYKPNRFSFVVVPELVEKAEAALEGTPYGLYVVREVQRYANAVGHDPECVRKAGYLHKDKADPGILHTMVRKACTEVEVLRRDKARGRYCTQCVNKLPNRCPNCEASAKKSRDYNRASKACWLKVDGMPLGPERTKAYQDCMRERGA